MAEAETARRYRVRHAAGSGLPADLAERAERSDPTGQTERVAERAEPAEPAEQAERTDPAEPAERAERAERWRGTRGDLATLIGAAALVGLAAAVGSALLARGVPLHADAPPLIGHWLPHIGPGTPLALALAAAAVAYGPTLADRLAWRRLIALAYAGTLAWTLALGMVDGWTRLTTRLSTPGGFLGSARTAGWSDLFGGFAGRILIDAPRNWPTHVAGHPPGSLAVFVGLERIGLSGPLWASAVCVAVGASAVVAVLIVLRGLAGEERARRAAPFLVFAPAAIWVGVSADAIILGATAWGLALLVLAANRLARFGFRVPSALGGGALLGGSLYLSYGSVVFGLVVLATAYTVRSLWVLAIAAIPVVVLVIAVTLGGFVWWQGYDLLVTRYNHGFGGERPYGYWVWADLAAFVLCVGPAAVVAVRRAVRRDGMGLVIAATVLAVSAASLSGMSKAEVERIWLPFAPWLIAACAYLPRRTARTWLAVQIASGLAIQHLILTAW